MTSLWLIIDGIGVAPLVLLYWVLVLYLPRKKNAGNRLVAIAKPREKLSLVFAARAIRLAHQSAAATVIVTKDPIDE